MKRMHTFRIYAFFSVPVSERVKIIFSSKKKIGLVELRFSRRVSSSCSTSYSGRGEGLSGGKWNVVRKRTQSGKQGMGGGKQYSLSSP